MNASVKPDAFFSHNIKALHPLINPESHKPSPVPLSTVEASVRALGIIQDPIQIKEVSPQEIEERNKFIAGCEHVFSKIQEEFLQSKNLPEAKRKIKEVFEIALRFDFCRYNERFLKLVVKVKKFLENPHTITVNP